VAEDNLKVEFHLTPGGWVRGTTRFFNNVQGEEVARPPDAVETCELHVYQASPWSKEERSWRQVWKLEQSSDAEIEKLHEKYPQPDESLPSEES